ncbi:hypothetical protein H7J87_12075 [Mycolicibacterium wolinskyi]|nr:hypothetical protein [Mycolicibacterium wolinskyi]MCV7296265.1 hypothetical protein [Mycolicibacterium goodii]
MLREIYWHGLGPCADPLSEREIQTAAMRGEPPGRDQPVDTPNFVYASRSKDVAVAFTTLGGGRAVCQVDPGDLPVEVDPDFPELGVRFRGAVQVVSTEVFREAELPTAREVVEILAHGYKWPDGSSWYLPNGFLRTPPAAQALGYADADFEWLGRWYPIHFLHFDHDGRITAMTDDGHGYVMFPPDHPMAHGRGGVPVSQLPHAWTRPGYFPSTDIVQGGLGIRLKWNPELADEIIHMPWEW